MTMTRPQFSVMTMLVVMAGTAVWFGTPGLIMRHGQFIEGVPCTSDGPFVVRGRFIRPFGPKEVAWRLIVDDAHGHPDMWFHFKSARSWFFVYSVNEEFELGGYLPAGPGSNSWRHVPAEPGEYTLTLLQDTEPAGREITGKLIVSPGDS